MLLKQYQKKIFNECVAKDSHSACMQRLLEGEPFEYVVNYCDFLELDLYVDKNVLIPRVETEVLAEHVIEEIYRFKKGTKVLDLCCGSGALGLSILKHTDFDVSLCDICSEALDVAKKNAEKNNLYPHFFQGDLLGAVKGKKFDVIVCNPPYVSDFEYQKLELSVKKYEPKKALIGGDSGLEFYQRLAKDLTSYLHPGAKVFFEIGASQGDEMFKIFSNPLFTKKELKRDYSGYNRFFFLEFGSTGV